MQAAAQAFIDSSISKTVNCPEDIDFDAFADIYVEGYHLGCKGLTTYRPNAVTGSVLSVAGPKADGPKPDGVPSRSREPQELLPPRLEQLHGTTYKLKWPESAHAVYVTINDVEEDGARRPFEMFINSKNMEHYAWTLGLTRMVSAVFRRSSDVGFVAEELKAVFDPRGGAWMGGRYVPSLLAAIGDIVERHLERLGADRPREERTGAEWCGTGGQVKEMAISHPFAPGFCPQCGASALVRAEGCNTCLDCGYSKCG